MDLRRGVKGAHVFSLALVKAKHAHQLPTSHQTSQHLCSFKNWELEVSRKERRRGGVRGCYGCINLVSVENQVVR